MVLIETVELLMKGGSLISTDTSGNGDAGSVRIKSRKTMEDIEIKRILDQQMPIEKKSKLADFVIETFNKRDTEKQVLNIIKKIESDFNA